MRIDKNHIFLRKCPTLSFGVAATFTAIITTTVTGVRGFGYSVESKDYEPEESAVIRYQTQSTITVAMQFRDAAIAKAFQ